MLIDGFPRVRRCPVFAVSGAAQFTNDSLGVELHSGDRWAGRDDVICLAMGGVDPRSMRYRAGQLLLRAQSPPVLASLRQAVMARTTDGGITAGLAAVRRAALRHAPLSMLPWIFGDAILFF